MRVRTTIICLAFAITTAHAAGSDPVARARATGSYQTAWLQLDRGGLRIADGKVGEAVDVSLFIGFREKKTVTAWFAHPALSGPRIVWLDSSSLTLTDTTLSGKLTGRTNLNWGNKTVHDFIYQIDATVASGNIAGTFVAEYVDDGDKRTSLKGGLSGRLVSAAVAKKDQLAAGRNWPHFYGEGFTFAGPESGMPLIDDLKDARPVWKSEAFIPTSYGSAPDSRYFERAGFTDSGGGSSTPLVVDGKVYMFFYYPRGPVGLDKAYFKYETEDDLIAKARELFPKRAVQQKGVVNHFRMQADEFLVCMDAATGQTLWKTVFPQRGNNYQTHKHRGHFPVALIANGVVYQPSTTGRLYAVDAATGSLRWEYPDAKPEPYTTKNGGVDCHAPSPVLVGGTVVFSAGNGIVAVDASTGKKKWQQPIWHRSSLVAWKDGDKTLVIGTDRDNAQKQNFAVAFDATDGKLVWRHPVEFAHDYVYPLLADDLLVGFSRKLVDVKPGLNDGLTVIHAYRIKPNTLEKKWESAPLAPMIDIPALAIHKGHVFVSTAEEVFCLGLTNGETVSSVKGAGGARTQTAFVSEGRLFIQPEGRHGAQSFFMLDSNPKALRILGQEGLDQKGNHPVGTAMQWRPPNSWTTAYANQPIGYPLVDGRLFVRGLDAIYCYDIRKP